MQIERINDVEIAYRRTGRGAPVLLLHPIGLDSSWWQPFAERLAPSFCVVCMDFRGHGGSAPIRGEIELADLADDAAALLRALGLGAAHVAGLSMGGMAAQYLAIRHPELVRSLALLGTACTLPDEARKQMVARGDIAKRDGMGAVLAATLERWFTPAALASALAKRCEGRLLANDVESWAACWRAISRLDTLPFLRQIRTPTLVVTGDKDLSTPPAAARMIAENIPGAALTLIEGAPHMGPFEFPETYLTPVVAFMQENSR
jgi:3-oxoadipate enol-lactonase